MITNDTQILQPTLFNYETLEPETRIVVQQKTDEIKTLMRRTAQDIIDIGSKLIEVKERLGHGNFGSWLDAEFGWTDRTALNFMRVSDKFKSEIISDLSIAPTALYLLAAPSTPEPARAEALARAENGESIGYGDAKGIVQQHKQPLNRIPSPPSEPEYTFEQRFDDAWEGAEEWACSECGQINAPFANECAGCRTNEEKVEAPTGFNVLHSSESNEWYTPEVYIEAARSALRGIDLDPASCEIANKTVRARTIFTKDDDGLGQQWFGSVFLNPPYGKTAGRSNQGMWAEKLIKEYKSGNVNEAILLVNAAPSNKWFAPLWDYPICFTKRRIQFDSPTGETESATHSNCLIYFGDDVELFKSAFDDLGVVAVRYGGEYAQI